MATAIIIFASLFAAIFISPWSLLLGLPLIILSLIVVIDPLRKSLITQPAYKALAKAMPSMSSTEREALDAGTSWWEKELFWVRLTGKNLMVMSTQLCPLKSNPS